MANSDSPSGLRPVRHMLGVPLAGTIHPYYIPSTYNTAVYVGDVVIKTGTANTARVTHIGGEFGIGTLPEINKATVGDGNRITGVVTGFMPTTRDSTVYGAAATERIALVCDDPFVVFEIQADGAIPATSIGLNAVLIATHSGSTTTGLSGLELDTTSDAPAADASNQLLILRAVNRPDNDTTLTHAKVEVLINQHTENPGTVGTLGI